jgi:hypothetical protein
MNASAVAALVAAGVSVLVGAGFLAVSWAFVKAILNTAHIIIVKTFEK